MESFGSRLSNGLAGRGRVVFEVKEENFPSTNKIESSIMYDKQGKRLGTIQYEITPEKKAVIQIFSVEDWSPRYRYPNRFLKWYVENTYSRGMVAVEGNIFSTDTHTHERLEVFRGEGFEVQEMGAMAGHMQYFVKLVF